MEKPNRDLKKEQKELLRMLENNTGKEIQESIRIALTALSEPSKPEISYSVKGTADADTKRNR